MRRIRRCVCPVYCYLFCVANGVGQAMDEAVTQGLKWFEKYLS